MILCSFLLLTFKTRVTSGLVRDGTIAHPFSLSYPHFTFMRRDIVSISKHADIRKDSWDMSLKSY